MIVALFFIAVIHKKWRRIKGSKCAYLGFLGSRDFSSANFLSVEMSRKPIPLTEFRQRSTRKKEKKKRTMKILLTLSSFLMNNGKEISVSNVGTW